MDQGDALDRKALARAERETLVVETREKGRVARKIAKACDAAKRLGIKLDEMNAVDCEKSADIMLWIESTGPKEWLVKRREISEWLDEHSDFLSNPCGRLEPRMAYIIRESVGQWKQRDWLTQCLDRHSERGTEVPG